MIGRNVKSVPQTARVLDASRKIRSSTYIFNMVLGGIFIAWWFTDPERFMLLLVMGVCFLGFGIFGVYQARRITKDRQPP